MVNLRKILIFSSAMDEVLDCVRKMVTGKCGVEAANMLMDEFKAMLPQMSPAMASCKSSGRNAAMPRMTSGFIMSFIAFIPVILNI